MDQKQQAAKLMESLKEGASLNKNINKAKKQQKEIKETSIKSPVKGGAEIERK